MLQREQADAQGAQQEAVALLDQSQQVEGQLQSEQSQVKGQLAVAIAQQQAAEAAAAAAAIRAAEEAAAQQAAAEQRAQVQEAAPQTTVATPVTAPAPTSSGPALNSFLQSALQAESGGNYSVVSTNGQYFGGFQFSQPAWDEAAQLAGEPSLVGVQPNTATPAQQNELAVRALRRRWERSLVRPLHRALIGHQLLTGPKVLGGHQLRGLANSSFATKRA